MTEGKDYTPTVTTLTFPKLSGGGTTLSFQIPITDDIFFESKETFSLSATIVNNLGNFTEDGDTATSVIIDNGDVSFDKGECIIIIIAGERVL